MSKHLSIEAPNPLRTLTTIDNRLALESNFLGDFGKTIASVVPSLIDSAKSVIESIGFGKPNEKSPVLDPAYKYFGQDIAKVNYMHWAKVQIFTPEGFAGNFLEYAALIQQSIKHANEALGDVVVPFNAFLSGLLSDNQKRIAQLDPNHKLRRRDSERDSLNKTIGAFFQSHRNTQAPLGDVVARNAEWNDLMLVILKIRASVDSISMKTMQSTLADTVQLLDAIKSTAKAGELNDIAGVQLRALSQNALSVAREAEFFAVTQFRARALDTAVNDSVHKLGALLYSN